MVWVKVDDGVTTHPKTLQGGLEELGLWVAGLAYCNKHTTGGVIPKHALRSLLPSDKVKTRVVNRCAKSLVQAKRWHDHDDHYVVHGYEIEQRHAMPEEVEKRRRGDASRQRKHRKAADESNGSERETNEKRTRNERETNEKRTRSVPATPTNPGG